MRLDPFWRNQIKMRLETCLLLFLMTSFASAEMDSGNPKYNLIKIPKVII